MQCRQSHVCERRSNHSTGELATLKYTFTSPTTPLSLPPSLPQHYSFYDFIINKARGKSGPLFSFDVHDDIRLVTDASIEKDEVRISSFGAGGMKGEGDTEGGRERRSQEGGNGERKGRGMELIE